MNERMLSTEAWLHDELEFINGKMSATLNGRMKAEFDSCDDVMQEITLKFPLESWEVNGLGTLHGGMASAMMDLAMSMAVYVYSRQTIPPTISMTTNYLRPIPMNGSVLMKARVTSLGRRNATAYCEAIIPGAGKVACTAIGTYAIIPKKAE
ncbi:MAG: PaaI family thioesterase [Oscillospiraceae bacterium]|nr:PaaI family thioesterase [Oscillospiraceae bacterium]